MICPVCGSDMQELSPQVWSCKCGHREIVEKSKQEKTEKEEAKEEYRKRFWEKRKELGRPSHIRGISWIGKKEQQSRIILINDCVYI